MSATLITSKTAGIHIPTSIRFGLWLVDGGFRGGHIVVSLYLESASGLGETNLATLEQLAGILWALKILFFIMGLECHPRGSQC